MKFPESAFWNYSCRQFENRSIADTCLQLQNACDADVNILLYCCWAADNRIQLDNDDLQKLIRASNPWQSAIIKPLRDARRMMKHQIIAMPANLHTQTIANLTEMELNAEHMAQLDLEKTIDFETRTVSDDEIINISARNLLLYVQTLTAAQTVDSSCQIADLLKYVYGDAEKAQSAMLAARA
jgi:uncharacterized protein (TIGR02444 family)